ncbi:MAG: hypothetical protein AMJ93_07195 [Anaerolineae bacterium SM23_84]|nr:MAG: hypothetical protein AMJ93_07195 [Anaerolineae bacterium SM23_84]
MNGVRGVITAHEMALVEGELERATASGIESLSAAGKHIIRAGGKRLRSRLLLLSYVAAGGEHISRAVPLAVAVELLHTASLIHDDIIDGSDLRRGRATINSRLGDSLALLVGDFVFTRLFDIVADFDSRIIRVIADACLNVVEGEFLETQTLGDMSLTEDAYIRIVRQKTASLFAASAELGALLASAPEQHTVALRGYGLKLGMAFQITDDTLDVVGERENLGKPVALDLEQGKMSLATLFALSGSERAGEVLAARDTARVTELLHDSGALEYAMRKARQYAVGAKRELAPLPESEAKGALCDLADFAVARDR